MIFEFPYGYGQEIYIEPDAIHIRPEWVNPVLHTIIIPDISPNQSNVVYEAYKELFCALYMNGYKILTDSRLANDNTFFFTPCYDRHINHVKKDYTDQKRKKVNFYLIQEGISEPFNIEFPPDSFPKSLPKLPFVFKNESNQGGREKFLIETPSQLETLRKFYYEIDEYSKNRKVEKPNDFLNYKQKFYQSTRIQEYIETPTEYNTSLRVLTSSNGDILASSLKYADTSLKTNEGLHGYFDFYLSDPLSPYFLNSKSIISNTVAGGNSILLGKSHYSELEQEILNAHDINPKCAAVPVNVKNACINIAVHCKRELGAVCGLDFIYDKNNREWKYLEEHEYPMLYSYAEKHNLPYDSSADDFWFVHELLDMKIRVRILIQMIRRKDFE